MACPEKSRFRREIARSQHEDMVWKLHRLGSFMIATQAQANATVPTAFLVHAAGGYPDGLAIVAGVRFWF